MPYRMQVKVKEWNAGAQIGVWKDVCPTNGPAYEYETKEEAERMLRICYKDFRTETRVIEMRGGTAYEV